VNTFRSTVPWQWREFEELQPESARIVRILDGSPLIQVCSTQYLGIPWDPRARAVFRRVVQNADLAEWGSFGSNYLGGTHRARLDFEEFVTRKVPCERAVGFASGWAANYAVAEALGHVCEVIISDKRSHNSAIHGLRGSNASVRVHDLNSNEWQEVFREQIKGKIGLFSPSVEGITGDVVNPIIPPEYRGQVLWAQDECHSFGTVGSDGFAIPGGMKPDLRILGLSKACGTMGSVVCGDGDLVDVLCQLASPWIFSTAVPPIIWRISLPLLEVVQTLNAERQTILELARHLRGKLRAQGIKFSGQHHITGIPLQADRANDFEAALRTAGFFVKVSQYPSRPLDCPAARICFTPFHTIGDVDRLCEVIARSELVVRI
jgi:8-amino-7-oxononanoate synthase